MRGPTLQTGKASSGGMYRYYAGSTAARMRKTGCKGLAVRMDRLDRAVINHLERRILDPNAFLFLADLSLKDCIAELTAIRDQAQADAERAQAAVERIGPKVTAESLKCFSEVARAKLCTETGEYHRDHLRAFAQRVEVASKSEIRLMGNKSDLLRTLGRIQCRSGGERRRRFVPKWRADQSETANTYVLEIAMT